MSWTYLSINLGSMLVPFLFSFWKKTPFISIYFPTILGISLAAIPFLIWDYWFVLSGHWEFNNNLILGLHLAGLPMEEWLFFLCIPYACLFIYFVVRQYFLAREKIRLVRYLVGINLVLSATFFTIAIFHYHLPYTFYSHLAGGILMILTGLFLTLRKLTAFWIAAALHFVPFFLVNGLLTSLPVVIYSESAYSGIRLGTIPYEDSVYSLALLGLNVLMFEYFTHGRKRLWFLNS